MSAGRLPRCFCVLFGSAVTLAAVILSGVPGAEAAVRAPAAAGVPARPLPYGPTAPVATAPGGFAAVVTSRTIGPAGGTITVTVDGVDVTLTVPPGAFPVPVQITVTAPDLAAIGNAGFAGLFAVGGVGIQVQENGSPYPGTFLKPVTLSMQSSGITSSSVVVVWNGTAFVTDSSATVTAGSATVSFDSDPNFAVLSPSGTARAPIAGATTPMTGEPFLGEGIVAGVLLLLGAAGLTAVIRRRRAKA
jgi:hypothetical protein